MLTAEVVATPSPQRRTPRVGVDFHVFDGIYQGSRSHVYEMFTQAIHLAPDIHFFLFLDRIEALKAANPIYSADNVSLVRLSSASPVRRLCIQLPYLQWRYKLDLLHTQYIMPLPSLSACIITLHDILFETHPQYFEPLFVLRSKLLMRLSAWRSRHVFTVSDYSRSQIMQRYGVLGDKISVTPNAVDTARFFPGPQGCGTPQRYGLAAGQYILTVGRQEPRKNHITLIQAFARLQHTQLRLVLAGSRHFGYGAIESSVRDLGLGDRVVILDGVPDCDLADLYRHAKVFVYGSWAEGFGMPPLEAMACGVPVITSNTTALPEVVRDAGILIEPDDVAGLAAAIDRVLTDTTLHEELRRKGLNRVQAFQWGESALKMLAVYRNILRG